MKKILPLLSLFGLLIAARPAAATPIVNTSGTSGFDSLYIPFTVADSTGNPGMLLQSGDTVYIQMRGAAAYVYRDSIPVATGLGTYCRLVSSTLSSSDGNRHSGDAGTQATTDYWVAISIPSISPAITNGIYGYSITAWHRTNADLRTQTTGQAMVYTTRDFNTAMDFMDAGVSTRSTFAAATDSVTVDASNFASRAGAITSTNFAAGAIDASAIATDAIGAAEIAASAIGSSELATGAITTAQFAAGAIDNAAANITEILNTNVSQISGSALAADSLEEMFIPVSGGPVIYANQFRIVATTSTDTAIVAMGSGDAEGMGLFAGGGTGAGIGTRFRGGLTGGDGFQAAAVGGNNHGFRMDGFGSGTASRKQGGATGVGEYIQGGATSGDAAQYTSISGDGLQLQSNGGGLDLNSTINLDDLTGTLDASEIGTGAITSTQIAASALAAIASRDADSTLLSNWLNRYNLAAGTGRVIDSSKGWGATAASSFNPATDPVIVGTINANVITATAIASNAITSAKIATDAIGAAQVAASAIGSSELASGAITTATFAAGAIDAAAIATDAIGAAELATDAITATEIATGAIGSAEFAADADGWNVAYNTAFTAGTMGDSMNNATAWTGALVAQPAAADRLLIAKIAITGATTSTTFISSTLTQGDDFWNSLLFEVITGAAAGQARYCSDFINSTDQVVVSDAFTVTPSTGDSVYIWSIANPTAVGGGSNWTNAQRDSLLRVAQDGGLNSAKFAAGFITSSSFASGAITSTVLASNAIGASQLATGAITSAKFASGAIDAAAIATDAIGSAEVAADAIGASELATDAIGASEIAAGAITSSEAPNLDAVVSSRSTLTAQGVWDLSFATGFAAGSMGDSLNNSTYMQGTASGLTAQQIRDSIFAMDSVRVNAISTAGANSFGRLLMKPSYVQGAASGLTAQAIWDYPFASSFAAGSMGDSLNNGSYVGGALAKQILDTLQAWDNAGGVSHDIQSIQDSIQAWDNPNGVTADIQDALDTLRTYDNAGRFQARVQEALDTLQTYDNAGRFQLRVQETLDTLQAWDNANGVTNDIQAVLDTVRNQDNWIARADSLAHVLHDTRIAAARFGGVPLAYDSVNLLFLPMDGTSNKDLVRVVCWRGGGTPTADTLTDLDYINTINAAVADAAKGKRRDF